MYKGKYILGMIPARGGSKGLPGKNIKPLAGKPLIAWTIESGLKSRCLDKVIVSTDDKEIADVSRSFGADVPFMRPDELSADTSKVIDAVFHAIGFFEKQGQKIDYLVLLEPTSPLRKDEDLDNAIKKLIDNEDRAESIISVGEIALEHPIYSKQIDEKGYVKSYVNMGEGVSLRQKLPKAYFPYGVIYMSKVEAMRKFNQVYPERILPHVIERWQNYEINDIYDFLCIETIIHYRKNLK